MRVFLEMINQNMPVLKTLIGILSVLVIGFSVDAIKSGSHKVNDGIE
ncbi:MAG: hypothetical protein P4N41_24850 [Negativicutes bacterium]|nr:hypothetical protein [Negativicutes bacterium]